MAVPITGPLVMRGLLRKGATKVRVVVDKVAEVSHAMHELASQRVLVGIPAEKAARRGGVEINNAALGYIQEHGAPEVNIPARPFLVPGVRDIQDEVSDAFYNAGKAALSGHQGQMQQQLHAIGIKAQAAVRTKITEGPFVPLAASTIAARKRRGMRPPFRPLIASGQMRNAVTYVIRKA